MKAPSRHYLQTLFALLSLVFLLAACGEANNATTSSSTPTASPPVTVHLGYFPNITHAVALVGVARGTFQKAIGANTLDAKTFNAGPDLISALLAGSIDIGYVGPNPAINGYVTSHGSALRIIAGASSGGASLVVRAGAHIQTASDLSGKTLADPQKGGTQDISLRYYLQQHNLKTTDKGGTVNVVPTDNPIILQEFKQGQIDGAWVPEPWASRLVQEDQGQVFVDERTLWPNKKFVTTNVIVRTDFLKQHPDVVKEFLTAHVETVQYINNNLPDAKKVVNDQLQTLTSKQLTQKVLDEAFQNLDITYDPLTTTLFKAADNAYGLGLLTQKPDKKIYDLTALNDVLTSKKLATIKLP